jgi:hypothetical protein
LHLNESLIFITQREKAEKLPRPAIFMVEKLYSPATSW